MTVIDAHQHFWVLDAHDQPFLRSHPSLAPLLRDFTSVSWRRRPRRPA